MDLNVVAVVLLAVVMSMLVEAAISTRHERRLRDRGAVEPPGDVYPIMRVAYPACFLAMAVEGTLVGPGSRPTIAIGFGVWALAKGLKWWAMAALGARWSFRVLVIPGEPLVGAGPYRIIRHPNYLAVCGELIGVAIMLQALTTGVIALVVFGGLMAWRIRVEERALGR
jgi:methyltransferase